MRNVKGITLISLVITIILLIILAGVTINLTIGEKGIITIAKKAKKEQDIARIKEELEIEKGNLATKENGKLDVNKYLEQIIDNGKITESDIDRNTEKSVNITVEGKYLFLVEKEEPNNIKIEYLGEVGKLIIPIPIITVENADTWTKSKNVIITETKGYTIKYTLDGTIPSASNGNTYIGSFSIDTNCTITAVYLNSKNQIGNEATNTITKIDTQLPNKPAISVTAGKHSMTIDVTSAEDASATESDGCSGIASYRYYCNGTWSDWITQTTYTGFNNIYGDLAGVSCELQVEVKDYAGNSNKSDIVTSKTNCLNTKHYVNAVNTLLSTHTQQASVYKYYKRYDGGALGASFYYMDANGYNWLSFILVSTTNNGAAYYETSGGNTNYPGTINSLNWNNQTYYYSTLTSCTINNGGYIQSDYEWIGSFSTSNDSTGKIAIKLLESYYN